VSGAPIIRAAGLTKRFDDFTAVDGLSFEVEPGSIFAFLGANGSGKSTTIRMLIGLLRPTAGAVEVDGIDVIRSPRRVRDHIGYMGQRVSLYQGLTLRENLEFYAGLYGLAGAELERRWGALAERFALRDAEHERAGDLSGGVRQRAGLALATLHRPRVLFLDEPTAGVDIENRLLFWDLIQEEAAAGVTVFVTTHFLEEVEHCDWICFIDAGRLIANGAPDALRARHSDGYRVSIDLPEPAARDAALAALEAEGRTVAPTTGGLTLLAPALTPDLAGTLARLGGPGRVRVEQPEMPAVFRRLMVEAAAEGGAAAVRPAEAPAPAAAGPAKTAAPDPGASPVSPAAAGAAATPAAGVPPAHRDPWRARLRRLGTLMQREARATLRDTFTVTILIAVPLGALLAFGFTISTDVRGLHLGVHDAGGTAASRRIVAELRANGTFRARPYATRQALDRALVAGEVSVAIVIPPGFDRALRRHARGGAVPEIQVLYDGAETVVAANAEAFLRALVTAAAADIAPGGGRRGLDVVVRALFNPTLDGVGFMVAGTYGFVLTFLTTLITAVSIVNERLTGTLEQLQVTPATSGEILLGKTLPLGLVFAGDVVLMLLTGGLLLGVWPVGSSVFFVTVASFYVLISLALGLIFSATSSTALAAVQKTVLFSIPLIFLGGFVFPIRNMPAIFRWVAELIPATHFIRIARAIYLRGEGPLTLAGELAMVGVLGAILMAVAARTLEARA
jgi:ribosome-dependent ATPase